MFAPLVLIYVALRLAVLGGFGRAMAVLIPVAVAIGLGSAFFLVPFALERSWTGENFSSGALITLAWPLPGQIGHLLFGGTHFTGPDYAASIGLPVLACALLGLLAWRGEGRRRLLWAGLILLTVLPLFLHGIYVRNTIFTLFFVCAAAAVGLDAALRRRPGWGGWLPVAAFLLFVLDATPRSIQPWTRTDVLPVAAAGPELARRAPASRVVEVNPDPTGPRVDIGPHSSAMDAARIQVLHGPHKPDSTTAHNAIVASLKIAEDSLRATGRLDAEAHAALAELNAGWIVGLGGPVMGLPPAILDARDDPVLGRYLRLEDATPVLASGRLEQAPRPAAFDALPFWEGEFDAPTPEAVAAKAAVRDMIRRMDADLATRQARAFLVPERPIGAEWAADSATAPLLRLEDYVVEPGRLRLRVQSDRAGFIRLAHPWYATTQATRNGEKVADTRDIASMLVLPLLAGENRFEVTVPPSPLRRASFALTAAVLGGCLLGLVLCGVRVARRRPAIPLASGASRE
jgi:hypothetical protein